MAAQAGPPRADFEVTYHEWITNTPALRLAVLGWAHFVERGWDDGMVCIENSHSALLAWDGGKPVGVLTYVEAAWSKTTEVRIGFVLEPHRGRGVYAALWRALNERAGAAGVTRIISGVAAENDRMIAVAARQGRRLAGHMYFHDVPGFPEPETKKLSNTPLPT